MIGNQLQGLIVARRPGSMGGRDLMREEEVRCRERV